MNGTPVSMYAGPLHDSYSKSLELKILRQIPEKRATISWCMAKSKTMARLLRAVGPIPNLHALRLFPGRRVFLWQPGTLPIV